MNSFSLKEAAGRRGLSESRITQLANSNIFYIGILSGDLGVHIGVYQPCPRFFIRWIHIQSSSTT